MKNKNKNKKKIKNLRFYEKQQTQKRSEGEL